jgi:hypothetical protein
MNALLIIYREIAGAHSPPAAAPQLPAFALALTGTVSCWHIPVCLPQMKTAPLLVFAILLQLALAQDPPSTSASAAPEAAELTQLLKDFLQGASQNDIASHERFWADDVIYTSSLGRRRMKDDILRDVRKENSSTPKNEQTNYSAEDIRIRQYGTTAIVAFELVGTTTKDGKTETARYLNTGTFLKRNGK